MHMTHIFGSGVQLEPELKRVQPTGESKRRGVASAAGASRPLIGGSDQQVSYTAAGCLFTSQAFTSVRRAVAKPTHMIRVRPDGCLELIPIMPGYIGRTE